MAFVSSPPASVSAFLHSIMPAPVLSRSALTACAVISAMTSLVSRRGRARAPHGAPVRRRLTRRCGCALLALGGRLGVGAAVGRAVGADVVARGGVLGARPAV